MEADDDGFPPDPIRQHLIATGGCWALHVDVDGPDRLKACKVLHCDLGTMLEEVKRMRDRMPGVVYTGTTTEVEWLRHRVAEFGFPASVHPATNDPDAKDLDLSTRLQPDTSG